MLRICPHKTQGRTSNAKMNKLLLIGGDGTNEHLATAVRKVYDNIKEIRAANPQPKDSFSATALPEKNSISAEPLNKIFGMIGEASNGMVKFSIGHPATMHGVK